MSHHLKELFEHVGHDCKFEDERTIESITGELVRQIVDKKKISGDMDPNVAWMRVIEERVKNDDFRNALQVVAETVLGLFPKQGQDGEG